MKTLILYATKYGATHEISMRLKKSLSDADICDIKSGDLPQLSEYDCIIIGSSLYAGQIRKEAKLYIKNNLAGLLEKRIGLFLSGLGKKEANHDNYFNINFPAEILDAAHAKVFLSGVFDPKKASKFDKFIYKMVAKQSEYTDMISDEDISDFAKMMQQ